MGKPRRKTGGGGKGKEDVLRRLNADVDGLALGDGKRKKKRERPPMTVKDCLDKAKDALDAYNVDDAFRHCAYALEMEQVSRFDLMEMPGFLDVLETMIELGDILAKKQKSSRADGRTETLIFKEAFCRRLGSLLTISYFSG